MACVAEHAARDHGMKEIPAAVVEQVKANVREVGAGEAAQSASLRSSASSSS
jgi:hypothetical protein